ncbi:DNA-directed RNA polymerase subunit beta' [Candidatus Curtissbacteria bacterium RIFCSPHIGHO2_01_FULL_41_44]|uniref:DNA-directed RNA polymerase subunit beta' n=1 Tax=Candidatus Curtissbacteria bacterium RIFCSPLOWO2_01_FULL_42_50 TaxID=1797730 RepID=A0A1F5H2L0_9BACT|nr:MAG: DNA-directed RNA polymerase subunit beta' [Candidatus Curtissbacteria bacterium RIFCSPHIGHO2_02_FULL_42_58]OGD94778.1 MAG: DNA-directed RNA polymerase subunit beta' [Candidatus Curtissbacteria bacterium RIFCSPHIGHO2_01_FULL_41_44]OGD96322.1 MAG: DNA-directed RNA polymerase subunit beta' [Candidatus Curtissbacteria bacterium RIFCSPHIGHO2_12_FULL_42_33]OGD98341.1 MAG: DNA-directed RNA polymerase subunit beta' [Candidatus Curtissbacteria bacterium RIFCSPLOWO2_01_FULL_42_50]OGE02978.1 MAG: 
MNELIDFETLRLTLASADDIKTWSFGEVTKPETINYRTLKPEKDGLFDERIFGPTKDWECYCGKYKKIRYRGIICDKCGVEVTQSRVRRERMGHINLAAPVAHNWFFKGSPSKLGLILDIAPRSLESVVYFASYIVCQVDDEARRQTIKRLETEQDVKRKEQDAILKKKLEEEENQVKKEISAIKSKKNIVKEQTDLKIEEIKLAMRQKAAKLRDENAQEISRLEEIYKNIIDMTRSIKHRDLLSEDEYLKLGDYNSCDFFKVGMGAEALLAIIEKIDLSQLSASLKEEITRTTGQRHLKATKRLRVVENMRKAGILPTYMIAKILPVLPPDLRPMVQLSGGRFATSDLNDLYRRVINRNNRLKKLIELGAPEIILRNEKRMLQEAVDALIDSQRTKATRLTPALRSLSDMLRGKQGRFRQNLLGKRVDYSGRSVIVVGPELNLNQAGIPKEMALEMFKPFVLREIITLALAPNVKSAKHYLERRSGEIWDILEEITKNHPILLNRAPTLHRLGIQAFYPILIEGDAIRIHPCICAGFNADFDGDQMAVHVPLSLKSQEEAIALMMAGKNLLRPADGSPITLPNKEMALGVYYLTLLDTKTPPYDNVFESETEVILAKESAKIKTRQQIQVKIGKETLTTSAGRVLFNIQLPQSLKFINEPITASTIKRLIDTSINTLKEDEVIELIDKLKSFGFEGATFSGLSVSVFDCMIVDEKSKIIEKAEKEVESIEKNFKLGLITRDEEKRLSQEVWLSTTNELADLTWKNLPKDNSIKIISDSGGSRATAEQIKQLAAIRGLVTDPSGSIVPLPIKSNFREGLSVFEYFTSARGARKGLADRAIKTAESGYLTRRLVDVAHDAIVRLEDCATQKGITISRQDKRRAPFSTRLLGRITAADVISPKSKKVLAPKGTLLTENIAQDLEKSDIEKIQVYSPITCEAKYGLCAKCYGMDLVARTLVALGTPVGVIAAQSIGEPGTQLTMRTFHTGGIVGLDITQGLPRVEELFEVRTPKYVAQISEITGKVKIEETKDGYSIRIKSTNLKPSQEREYTALPTAELAVTDGQLITAGTALSTGYLDVKEILAISGLEIAQKYIIDGTQEVYESQGVVIHDKHFEVIVRKMSEKVRIESSGDTVFLPSELIGKNKFQEENAKVLAEGGEPATAQVVILGITRAALYTDSFLSAASFQETTRVLTDAAIEGKDDRLLGLKENVIIGRLIPTSPDRAKIE